jgi:ABC-type amino acid transport/signal transduction systems, periplasmic component/domain
LWVKKDEKKVVYVGTNAEFAPFEFLEGDKVTGFDMELIAEIGKVAGFEVEVKNQAFDGLLPALQSGKIDLIIAGMTVTDERKKQ